MTEPRETNAPEYDADPDSAESLEEALLPKRRTAGSLPMHGEDNRANRSLRGWIDGFPSDLGWRVNVILLGIILFNVGQIGSLLFRLDELAVVVLLGYIPIIEFPQPWSFLIESSASIVRLITVIGIARCRYWGIFGYWLAVLAFAFFRCYPDMPNAVIAMHVLLGIALLVVLTPHWQEFD